jgi:hypothetical protein
MRIQSPRFLFFCLDKWRGNLKSVSFNGTSILVSGSKPQSIDLSELASSPSIERKWIGSELSLMLQEVDRQIRIRSGDSAQRAICEILWMREFSKVRRQG